ncbi:GRAM domain-containing protein 2B isoform X2 [Ictalurus punctatus]|uniref:GRAM domain-containing protein 2B isoform X2 n=1 Tax=Ictalurus punctatus TaxID=7998 RepID=A0A9F7TPB3_ICTPU|nr:GRAM domain-containing protein 2B isoform X2 [Ictalurus punctatus]
MVLMIEQTDRIFTPLSSPEGGKTSRIDKKDLRIQTNSEAENVEEKLYTESDLSESRRKSPILRIKLPDQPSLTLSPTDSESKLERKKTQYSQFSKANAQYHKLFKELSNDEILKQSYTCALQKDILYQGRLFVSDNWICFHSKVFGRDTKIAIPVLSITLIKKTKTALLVPNALVITTTTERHLFVSFLSRDTTYKFLLSVCIHLRVENAGSTPVTSSAENSFRADCPSSLPLVSVDLPVVPSFPSHKKDFSADFSDLDGVVRQRRQELLDSSSSGSQTPDYEKMTEFPPLTENFLDVMKSGEMAVHADIHLQTISTKQHNGPVKAVNGPNQQEKFLYPLSLNSLLLVYLFLVCVLVLSSCYMAFKILALEQRLNSLGSLGDYSHENALHHRSQVAASAEIYGELSTNLFKLEKIQKNLRKLLEGS